MSADSQNHPSLCGGHVVSPQPMSDKSIIESVAGFINDVVPQGYASGPITENKEQITWARFEYGDINDPVLFPDSRDDHNNTAPLLLVLGYGSGVQVWAIPASGEATEVLSWRQGTVRTLRILPTPAAEHGSTGATGDIFAHKRPLVALCDSSSPGAQFCSVSFISLRAGDQVKSIKFKNPVNDVLANRRSVIVTFSERIAVFDASTLEDRLTITTCYPSPGPNPNPVALGSRWLAFAEKRLIPSKRCSGGTEGEGVQSYTAAVLHAAKTLSKGLRGLGETVASSLTGSASVPGSRPLPSINTTHPDTDSLCPGIVTIIDVKGSWKENGKENEKGEDNVVAHFTGHGDAIVALQFDPSGMLLLTADKRGHDFHLFRIHPHPGGSTLAAVHHLYVLHRGDTTAKVQDIAFASDSRWVAVSTLRGTTHVFPMTPYGGSVGLRTHSTPHVVNRLSRFHRSAGLSGLSADGRNSPQGTSAASECPLSQAGMPYLNPRLPPYPLPTTVSPLAQIRQLTFLSAPSSAGPGQTYQSYQTYQRNPSSKTATRNHAPPEDNAGIILRVSACFAPSRAWLVGSPTVARDGSNRALKKPVESLFVMACHGNLVEYELDTKHATGIPKEKLCDDTAIELEVQAKARWLLMQSPPSVEVQPPLAAGNLLLAAPPVRVAEPPMLDPDERWLSHVEIVTHAGPHRRLWMGPQFTFKTYSPSTGVPSVVESESVEIGCGTRLTRSNPVNMPLSNSGRPVVPFLIESGSSGSYDQSVRLVELYGGSAGDSDSSVGVAVGETQLREELADAMMESPGRPARDIGRRVIVELRSQTRSQTIAVEKIVNPVGSVLTVVSDRCASNDATADGDCAQPAVHWPSDVVKLEGNAAAAHHTTLNGRESVETTSAATDSAVDSLETSCVEPEIEALPEIVKIPARRKRDSVSTRRTLGTADVAKLPTTASNAPGVTSYIEPEIESAPEETKVPVRRKRDGIAGRRKLGGADTERLPAATIEAVVEPSCTTLEVEPVPEEVKILELRKRDGIPGRRKLGSEKTSMATADAPAGTSCYELEMEPLVEEVKTPELLKRHGIAGRRKLGAGDADFNSSKLPLTRGEKRSAVNIDSGDKTSHSKPVVSDRSLRDDPLDLIRMCRETTPEQTQAIPSSDVSVNVPDLTSSGGVDETARDINDSTSMTDSKTESELIAPKLEDVFDTDIEHLLDEVSSNSEDYKPLKRVSKSKIYPIDNAEMSFLSDLPVAINCSVDESDPVDECQRELNEISFNDSPWADKMEPLPKLDFIDQSSRNVWNKMESHELKCEALIDEISDDVADEIESAWAEGNEPVLPGAMDVDERLAATSTMASNQDPDTLSLLQNSKKNKKKNKRRR